ncbi:hypothetical protein Bhyg_05129 [Pseudolycoriella hygida]|uniref:Uncharacterized protein n=1 Tax=Pseudolycoriella hygida TaxID=35572 RepID=A0A9Q0NGV8_9DIPT|nr:hypothetical protein Bhyg_05129 [Pseudolycoriella hygida]
MAQSKVHLPDYKQPCHFLHKLDFDVCSTDHPYSVKLREKFRDVSSCNSRIKYGMSMRNETAIEL